MNKLEDQLGLGVGGQAGGEQGVQGTQHKINPFPPKNGGEGRFILLR